MGSYHPTKQGTALRNYFPGILLDTAELTHGAKPLQYPHDDSFNVLS